MTTAPLSLSLNKVDTSMPLLMEGKYTLNITSASVVPNKEESGFNLKVTYKTVDDAKGTKGEEIKAGYPLTRFYPLPLPDTKYGKGVNEHAESFEKTLALFQLAACGLKNTPESVKELPPFNDQFLADIIGRQVVGQVKTSKSQEGDTYGPRSEVGSVSALDQ